MPGRNPFVAENAPDLIHFVYAADNQALQVKLQRNPQVQFHVKRVVVGQERTRRRAAGDRLQHRGFDFQVVVAV